MERVLALPDGCGDEAGLAGSLSRSVGLKRSGAVGRGSALRGEHPSPRYVNLFTTLRTISSNGAGVKTPPACTRSARAIRAIDGGPWAMTSRPLRRHRQGPGVRLGRTQQAGRCTQMGPNLRSSRRLTSTATRCLARSDQVPGWPYCSRWLPCQAPRPAPARLGPAPPPSFRIAASAFRCRCWSSPSSTLMSS
jgi:hypothetical protein